MLQQCIPALRMTLLMTVVTGLLYPALVTGIAQLVFPKQANGSLIVRDGRVVGSELIGQTFAGPIYFHSRPSAAGNGYDAAASGGSNLGPTSAKLIDRVKGSVSGFRSAHPEWTGQVPADAVLASGSGLDPHITPANAAAQAIRVAGVRGTTAEQILRLIQELREERDFVVLGEPRVNVLRLNLALDDRFPVKR